MTLICKQSDLFSHAKKKLEKTSRYTLGSPIPLAGLLRPRFLSSAFARKNYTGGLKMKNFIPRNIAYILLAKYGMTETYFGRPSLRCMQCKMSNLVSTKIFIFYIISFKWCGTLLKNVIWHLYAGNAVSETQNSEHFQGVMPHLPPYGNVLSLYREGPWAPSSLKWQGPLMGPYQSLAEPEVTFIFKITTPMNIWNYSLTFKNLAVLAFLALKHLAYLNQLSL